MNQIENITFGVELETTIPASAAVNVGYYHAGRPALAATINGAVRFFPTFNGVPWKAEADGSIRVTETGHRACEFVSPILKGEEGIKHLAAFVEFLRELGAKVNTTCGMHIHIGINGATGADDQAEYLERLTRLVAFNSKALYAQTGTLSRETGNYCAPIGANTKRAIARIKLTKNIADAANAAGRYHILNLTCLTTRQTVEFRCFAGTLNTSKVLLHLFSVLALCVIARNAKTPAGWENKTLTGEKALTNFLKVRPMTRIVGSPFLTERFPQMITKALEMAGKYDAMQAAVDLGRLLQKSAVA